ncbi:MAG: NUDIX domain-containing protein [Bdellovibrionota bacterium]
MNQRLSCGVVPLRKKNNHWEVLILRCFKNWDFPKGMKDPDESPISAARREFTEETHLKEILISSPELFIDTEPYSNNKVARYFLGIVVGGDDVKITPNPITGVMEHHEFRWVKIKDADDMLVPRLKKVLKWAKENLPE